MIAHVHAAAAPLRGTIAPPPSKNYTTRYLIASALAAGRSTVLRPAVQDDAVALVECLRRMGARIEAQDRHGAPLDFAIGNAARIDRLVVDGFGAAPRLVGDGPLMPGNAGAVLRMLLGVSALMPEVTWDTEHRDSLGKRPNRDLLDALAQLGVECRGNGPDGRLPITLRGGPGRIRAHMAARRRELALEPGEPFPVSVSAAVSSQFASAMLFLAPLLGEPVRLSVSGGLGERSHIEATRRTLIAAGVPVESSHDRRYHDVMPRAGYLPQRWQVNGDWPGTASILSALAVVPGSEAALANLADDEQGERTCLEWFAAAGCTAGAAPSTQPRTVRLAAPQQLRAACIDGDRCTDAVLALLAAAMVAEGESRFFNITNLQFKECDRVREPIEELRKVYATALAAADGTHAPPADRALLWEPDDRPDTIRITGWPAGFRGGIEVDGRGDHRVIMMLSAVALRCREGLRITGAEHVAKSFPGWFDTMRALGARVDLH